MQERLKTEMKLHIGFDDTDSPRRGCTTYISALIIEKMRELGASFIDYPNLIRLNPNVPWKTRGNGALCLRILCEDQILEAVKECVVETVEEHADLSYRGTDPGIVFLAGEVPSEIEAFAQKTISGVVRRDEALNLIKKFKAEAVGFKKGRGIIGGLAAIGETLKGDHTYEFIAYRKPENWGTPRRVDRPHTIRHTRGKPRNSQTWSRDGSFTGTYRPMGYLQDESGNRRSSKESRFNQQGEALQPSYNSRRGNRKTTNYSRWSRNISN